MIILYLDFDITIFNHLESRTTLLAIKPIKHAHSDKRKITNIIKIINLSAISCPVRNKDKLFQSQGLRPIKRRKK